MGEGNLIAEQGVSIGFATDFGKIDFDNSKNIYVTGKDNYYVSKYDSLGNLIWNKSKANSIASDLVVTSNSVFVTSKYSFLGKYDFFGNESFPAILVPNAEPSHIVADISGNVYISGQIQNGTSVTFGSSTYTPPNGTFSYFVVKYNSSGQLQWSKHIITNTQYTQSISMDIYGNDLYLHVFANAMTAGTVSGNFNGRAIYKVDTSGADKWIRQLISPVGNMSNDMAINSLSQIVLITAGGIIIADTSASNVNYYSTSGAGLDQSICIYNDKYTILSNNFGGGFSYSISTGSFSDLSQITTTYINIPSDNTLNRYLIEYNNNGELYGYFSTNGTSSDTAFVDINFIPTNSQNKIIIAKYNAAQRLLPSYEDVAISCGDAVQLGIDLNAFPYSISSMPSISWDPSTGLSNPGILNPIATPLNSTEYSINIDGKCTQSININVENPSSFSFTTTGMVATFTVNNPSCSSFLWDFGNGNTSSINPNPTVTYATAGIYGVCLKCNNQPSSCVQCINITVPSNTSGTTGVEEVKNTSGIKIYPNPTSDFITIENTDHKSSSTYVILNSLGQQVLSGQLSGETTIVDIGGLSSGFYLLKIGEMGNKSFKLIKE